jgi:hypothetical protein
MNLTQYCARRRPRPLGSKRTELSGSTVRELLLSTAIPARFLPVGPRRRLLSRALCSCFRITTQAPLGAGLGLETQSSLRSPAFPSRQAMSLLKRDGPENWVSSSSFFIHIKIHKSLGVDISLIDKQVTCRRGIPPSKNGRLRYYKAVRTFEVYSA